MERTTHSSDQYPTAQGAASRLMSIDTARGLVMVLMTLDHVRDYFGAAVNPTDPRTTTVALFFTRWVTHFCAPTFFLLTGVGAYLSASHRSRADLSTHLMKRGLWLIVLETVIMRCLAFQFNFDFRVTLLFVLWALGWSMITLGALVRWAPSVALIFGAGMIALHNLLDLVNPKVFGAFAPLWSVLHQPNFVIAGPRTFVFAAYPLIPWVGVTALGYGIAEIFQWEPARRRALLLRAGMSMSAAFVALRALNVYGDPSRWSTQKTAVFTVLSFLNTTKYPPSLLFLLMTLGPLFLFLWAIDGGTPSWLRRVNVLGRVPLFYYSLHIFVIHLLALIVCFLRYGEVHWMFESPKLENYPFTQPPGWPLSLPYIYMLWGVVVVLLWPACRWYADLKRRRRTWWFSYM
ncbi:MAG: heparan-alpha-glucosaminide N-acetyltransferase domain-containing protein [Gemmatimonadaceae bacterium]